MTITRTLTALAAAASLAACASQPENIEAAHVSATPYQAMTCAQLRTEGHNVNARLAQATATQERKAGNDAALMTAGLILFAPAVLFIGGDKAPAAELASLKGQVNVINQAADQKGCRA